MADDQNAAITSKQPARNSSHGYASRHKSLFRKFGVMEAAFVMKRTNNYLPGYDKATRRAEFAAFLSLGIVAAPVMLYAVYQSFGFSVEQPSVVAALKRSATHMTAVARAGEVQGTVTNLAVVNSQTHRTMIRIPGPKT